MDKIFKSNSQSLQFEKEQKGFSGLIEPFFSFDRLLEFYYANTYHRRCIMLKAALLSNIEDGSKLENQSISPKDLLYAFILNAEIYGNAFMEICADKLYILPTFEARLNENREIYQVKDNHKIKLNAKHLFYYSPRSRYYGEPDYLATLLPILVNAKADRFNEKFFDNSARADKAIIFENSEPSEEQLNTFKEFFSSEFKGFNNAHKTMVVTASGENARVRFEDLSKVDDLSFKELKQINRDEIIAAHGVPPRMVGVLNSGGLGGGGELIGQLHAFNELTIIPKQEQIEWFFYQIGFPIKLKPIDVSNFKDDSDLVTNLVQNGILNLNEARAILGYENQ